MKESEKDRALKVINERLGHAPKCPLCQKSDWVLSDDPVMHSLQDDPNFYQLQGPYLPTIALICNYCGNTHFLNLKVLGLEDFYDPKLTQE